MNNLDRNYQQLLKDIIEYGVTKKDRTGTGTKSIFGYTIRHNMAEGFPLLTTKKMAWKTLVTELLWFLKGDTNIKYLVDNGCNIWNGDAYKGYEAQCVTHSVDPMSKEQFISAIKLGNNKQPHFIPDLTGYKLGELGPIYGKQWREWITEVAIPTTLKIEDDEPLFVRGTRYIDQIANLIKDLKTNPDSRRLIVSAWNVGELDLMVLPPCHYGFQVYTRELVESERYGLLLKSEYNGKELNTSNMMRECDDRNIPTRAISLMWNQRSVDTFLGLPFNIASYGLLLEIFAKEVNMVPDQLIGNLGDTHLYSNHIEQAKEQIERRPMKLPTLNINTEFWKTESGECGVGPLNTNLQGFEIDDFTLKNYQSHPAIKAPLSN